MSVNAYFSTLYAKASEKEKAVNNAAVLTSAVYAADEWNATRVSGVTPSARLRGLFSVLLDNGWKFLFPSSVNLWKKVNAWLFNALKNLPNTDISKASEKLDDTGRWCYLLQEEEGRIVAIRCNGLRLVPTALFSVFDGKCYRWDYGVHEVFANSSKYDWRGLSSDIDFWRLVDYLYGFETKPKGSVGAGVTISEYFRVKTFFGNNMEELLRLNASQSTPWLFQTFADGLTGKAKGKEFHGLRQLFGVNKQELKYFLSQPTDAQLTFYLAARRHNEMSVTEAMKVFDKIVKTTKKYDLDSRNEYYYWFHPCTIYGAHGAALIKSFHTPKLLGFYSTKRLWNSISVSKYVRYLIDEKRKNPEMSLAELERQLEDYNKMLKMLLGEKTKFELPYNIVNAHNTMVKNYNAIVADGAETGVDTPENIKKLSRLYHDEWNTYTDDKFLVLRPYLPSDLHREGAELNHCVGTYTNTVLAGRTKIFFVRKKSQPEKPLVTIEVNGGRIRQERGKGNRMTTPEEHTFIKNWIKVYNENSVKMKDVTSSPDLPKKIQDYLDIAEAKQKKARENAVAALQHRTCVDDRTAAAL